MLSSEKTQTPEKKAPQARNVNAQLSDLAGSETTNDTLALTLAIVSGLGARPVRVTLVRDGREETVTSKTREIETKTTDIEMTVSGSGTRVLLTCSGAVGAKLKKEIEAVLQVAALRAELCARKLWQPEETVAVERKGGLIGESPAMLEVVKEISLLARSAHPVMITGERGTGKTTAAEAIHDQSGRSGKFVDVDCTTLGESLLEAELFGYEKGAFTGAGAQKRGLFETAENGTIFLDEIAEMPTTLQVKLLKAVEQRKIRRVGGTHDIPVNVRVIAATSQDLQQMIQEGKFRAELFDRLSVLELRTRPLREKREDIPSLINHRLKEEQRLNRRDAAFAIEEEAVNLLVGHDWPGNIRELQNAISKLTARVEGDEAITVEEVRRLLPARKPQLSIVPSIADARGEGGESPEGDLVLSADVRVRRQDETLKEYLARVTVAVIEASVAANDNRQKLAAKDLGITRSSLSERLAEAKRIVENKQLRSQIATESAAAAEAA